MLLQSHDSESLNRAHTNSHAHRTNSVAYSHLCLSALQCNFLCMHPDLHKTGRSRCTDDNFLCTLASQMRLIKGMTDTEKNHDRSDLQHCCKASLSGDRAHAHWQLKQRSLCRSVTSNTVNVALQIFFSDPDLKQPDPPAKWEEQRDNFPMGINKASYY